MTRQIPKDVISRDPVTLIDYRDYDLIHAHYLLGYEAGDKIRLNLQKKLKGFSLREIQSKLNLVKKCRLFIEEKIRRQHDKTVCVALDQYLNCLDSWTEGARLQNFNLPKLESGSYVPSDLGFLLQMEETGCQIGAYRTQNGGVFLWHTEEELDHSRFDKLRIASFRLSQASRTKEIFSFIYPDLLPGPAFGWVHDSRSVFVQAVASLPIRLNLQNAMIANIATWIILFHGNEIGVERIINEIGPFMDGYAIMTASTVKGVINASRVEFAHNLIVNQPLGDLPGTSIYQTNAFSEFSRHAFTKIHAIKPRYSRLYYQRAIRNSKTLSKIENNPSNDTFSSFYQLICSEEGKEFAYANVDVMGHFLCFFSPSVVQIKVGPGSARWETMDQLLSFSY